MPVTGHPPTDTDLTVCPVQAGGIGPGRARAWLLGGVLALTTAAAASADDAPLHTPCLTAHASLSGYIADMEASGWTLIDPESDAWGHAAGVVTQPHLALQLLVPSFDTLAAATEFTEAAMRRGTMAAREDTAMMTRDGVTAAINLLPLGQGAPQSLTCTFAATSLPEAAAPLTEGAVTLGGILLSHREISLEDGGDVYRFDAIRLLGAPVVTALLTGREAILIRREVPPPS